MYFLAETRLANADDCYNKGETKVCECNRDAGYYGDDGMTRKEVNAKMLAEIQQPGFELTQNGTFSGKYIYSLKTFVVLSSHATVC